MTIIYQPAEDSYLLSNAIKKYLKNKKNKDISILDMGSGSGIQAQTCKDLGFKKILTADINQEAIKYLENQGFNTIQSDLFENIKEKYNLIIFNAPYLPEDKREPEDSKIATTAGKKGYETIVTFLEDSKKYLYKKGEILLLFSSLSKPNIIKNKVKKLGFSLKLLDSEKLFFEEIYVFLLTL